MEDPRPIEAVDDDVWPDPGPDATGLVRRVHALRRQPVADLAAEGLRLLLSQHVSLDVVLPEALRRLADNPLLEGDCYPGDVLAAVLRVDPAYWASHPDLHASVREIIGRLDPDDIDYPEGTDLSALVAAFA